LQRVVTDFAADVPFAQAMDKLVEHYGVLLGESTIRRITENHARMMFETHTPREAWPEKPGCEVVVAEMDGGMVPLVEPDAAGKDRRKGKRLYWKEAKICLAHACGSQTLAYGGTLQGDAETAGRELFDCAQRAGFGNNTHVHAVGDGAEWIAGQVDERFGAQGSYLIDFYHVCEYLSATAKAIIHGNNEAAADWMSVQKEHLKSRRIDEVIRTLNAHLETAQVDDTEAPVRRCHRYLSQRTQQLDYQNAIARNLPIGSGEIESAHRYLVQQRLKRPGAWWRAANAEHMLALRLNRANHQWKAYWAADSKLAA
jgi:hypothetical protein